MGKGDESRRRIFRLVKDLRRLKCQKHYTLKSEARTAPKQKLFVKQVIRGES